MTKLNNVTGELTMDELESVSGGISFSLGGITVAFGTDQTGAAYLAINNNEKHTGSIVRGNPA
jgi:hypothetical protein